MHVVQAMRKGSAANGWADKGFSSRRVEQPRHAGRGEGEKGDLQKVGTVPSKIRGRDCTRSADNVPELDANRVGIVGWFVRRYNAANGVLRAGGVQGGGRGAGHRLGGL